MKRSFDIFFSLLILLIGFPIYLLIALMIFLFSNGPIFYVSERLGKDGKVIKCYKFRTMYVGAEEILKKMLLKNPFLYEEWLQYYKLKNDPRITKIGKFLRKTSLDELPQFFNVLLGDLSVVGPRPLTLIGLHDNKREELEKILGSKIDKTLSVRPGITGIWQITGRSNLTLKEKIHLDEKYIEKHNFLSDLLIIVKTIGIIFSPKGAY